MVVTDGVEPTRAVVLGSGVVVSVGKSHQPKPYESCHEQPEEVHSVCDTKFQHCTGVVPPEVAPLEGVVVPVSKSHQPKPYESCHAQPDADVHSVSDTRFQHCAVVTSPVVGMGVVPVPGVVEMPGVVGPTVPQLDVHSVHHPNPYDSCHSQRPLVPEHVLVSR